MFDKLRKTMMCILPIFLILSFPGVILIAEELNKETDSEELVGLENATESDIENNTEEQPPADEEIDNQLPEQSDSEVQQTPSDEQESVVEDKGLNSIEELSVAIPTGADYKFDGSSISGLKDSYLTSLTEAQKQNIHLIIPKSIEDNGVEKGVTAIADNAFSKEEDSEYKFTFLDLSQALDLVSIGQYAFYMNSSITNELVIPESVQSIGNYAFDGCSGLTGSLVLPNSVKTLGTYAFRNCSGMTGTLTLSNQLTVIPNYSFANTGFTGELIIPKGVTQIGDSAFISCSGLTGSLVLPDSVNTIGTHAFRYCNGMDGTLTLSNQLKIISNYSFANTGFTGELVIPEGVTQIGDSAFRQTEATRSFTGTLVIPESVKSIEQIAFSYQTGITSIEFPNTRLEEINASVFKGTGLSGVLTIPDSIKEIGDNSFLGTKLETVYLNNVETIKTNSFKDSNELKAIICDEDRYTGFASILNKTDSAKLGYPLTISFDDGVGGSYEPLERLYGLPYNLVKKEDGSWRIDNDYEFPKVLAEGKGLWGLDSSRFQRVFESNLIEYSKLYAIVDLGDPTFVFSEGVDKVYDGKPAMLSVQASHPLAKSVAVANAGDVIFRYTWNWGTIGGSPAVLHGWDKNIYSFSDVRMGNYTISACVKIESFMLKEGKKASIFHTETHDFPVYLRQAESILNPIYPKDTIPLTDNMPEIKTSEGDTTGVISWDANQTLKEGTHTYKWTFTPPVNAVGNYNYKTVKGTAELTATSKELITIMVEAGEHGKITPSGSLIKAKDELVEFRIVPEPGFKVASLLVNNVDVTSQINNNKYTLKVQSPHHVVVTFELMEITDIEDKLDSLPVIPEGEKPTDEQTEDILNAILDYDSMSDKDKDSISEDAKNNVYNALASLPQIEVETSGKEQIKGNANLLLENISSDEIKELLNDPYTKLSLALEVETTEVEDDKKEIINELLEGDKVESSFDIDVIKKIVNSNYSNDTKISELKTPIQLTFDVKDSNKEYYMIRLHNENGKLVSDILNDEDSNPETITVSSDKFSLYVLAYKEKEVPIPDGSGGFTETYYDVIFKSEGNNILELNDVKKGSTIVRPLDPIKEGYVFKGWYSDSYFTHLWDFEKDVVRNNLTLYALWEETELEEEIVEPVLPEEIMPNEEEVIAPNEEIVDVFDPVESETEDNKVKDVVDDSKPSEPSDLEDMDEEQESSSSLNPESKLPSTNDNSILWVMGVGFLTLILGILVYFMKRR